MTREEAIKVLEESKRQNEVMRDNPNTFYKASDIVDGMKNAQKRIDAIQMAISALREQEERDNIKGVEIDTVRNWIPVTERLPEESGMYIVTANDGHAQRVSFVLWQKKNRMWNLVGARSYWRVTHWQQMPLPPKGE